MTLTYEYGHSIALDYYHNDYVDDGEFEYEVEPTDDDYIEYLEGLYTDTADFKEKNEKKAYKVGFIRGINKLLNEYDLLDTLKESIDEEDGFYEFMKEKYAEDAARSVQDWYDNYD